VGIGDEDKVEDHQLCDKKTKPKIRKREKKDLLKKHGRGIWDKLESPNHLPRPHRNGKSMEARRVR
jgi:hypothetical protein